MLLSCVFFASAVLESEAFSDAHDDLTLRSMVLKIHHFLEAQPFPKSWAEKVIDNYDVSDVSSPWKTVWGEALKLILLASGFKPQNPLKINGNTDHWASGYLDLAETKDYLPTGFVSDLDKSITRNEVADLCAAALELTDAQPAGDSGGHRRQHAGTDGPVSPADGSGRI